MNVDTFDYIIVGAGSSGAIVAAKLSENERNRVLLLEAGAESEDPLVMMPKGVASLLGNPGRVWSYETESQGDIPAECWFKGRLLGGSSAVNGMMYFRGQAHDYADWEAAGARGWGWDEMARVFSVMEDHVLAGEGRGQGGPLGIGLRETGDTLCEAFIHAGEQMGVPRVRDLNNPDQEGVGYTPSTIRDGRRVSAARAFLRTARKRRNLRIETGVEVERILFDGTRAVGVACLVRGETREFRTQGEVILSAGAINSPAILQRSGVGDPARLAPLGVAVVAENREVGEHLLEHRNYRLVYDVRPGLSENPQYRGMRLAANLLRYAIARSGPMAATPFPVAGFFRSRPGLDRPDVQLALAPYVINALSGRLAPEPAASVYVFVHPCRPLSRGHVRIRSRDSAAPPEIVPNYLAHAYDRDVSVSGFRFAREWMRQPAIAPLIMSERAPTPQAETDDEILALFRTRGASTFHSCATCRMGDGDAVLDEKLRVRGVSRLRVIDASSMPTMPSCNTNGPALAVGWRGAELVMEGRNDR